MDLQEINKKISEYRYQLEMHNNYVGIKGGQYAVRKTISKDLIKQYKGEIEKLESERKHILEQAQTYHISWEHVYFDNYSIRVKFNNFFSKPFHFSPARKSFEYIKPYLGRTKLPLLEVTIQYQAIKKIENLEYFSEAVELLNYKINIDLYQKNPQNQTSSAIIKSIKTLSNKAIKELFCLNSRGKYLTHLCDIQSEDYKIIPVPEVFIFGGRLKEEDTFIFSAKEPNVILLIWESVNFARATYIFKVDEESYQDKLCTIFGYIVSSERQKRSSLRKLISQSDAIVVIEHNDYDYWKNRISMILKN